MGFDKVNAIIKDWGAVALRKAKTDGRAKGIRHRSYSTSPDDSLDHMTISYKKRAGDMISSIVLNIRRTLFYVRNGAGRGYGGSKGSVWVNAKGERKATNAESLGKAGTDNRTRKDFLQSVEESSEALIDTVAVATMDEIFSQAFNQ